MGVDRHKRTPKIKSDQTDNIVFGSLYLLLVYLFLLGILLLSGEALAQSSKVKIIPPKHRRWPGPERYFTDLALINLEYNLKKVEKNQPSIQRAKKAVDTKIQAKTEEVEFSLKTNLFKLQSEAEIKTPVVVFRTVGNLDGIINGVYYKKAYLENKKSSVWIGYRTSW